MAKDEKLKQAKETLCKELLQANPELSMKEVNVQIKEEFDSGVSSVVFSRIKKSLNNNTETDTSSPKPVEEKTAPKTEAKSQSKEEKDETKSQPEEEKEIEVQLEVKEQSESKAEEVVEEEPEPEIPVEKYPFKIKVKIPEASTVFIAGSFNKWKKDEYRLEREEGDWWVYDDKLPEGEHNYKFVVNSREWFVDLDKEIVTDTTGVSNTLVVSAQ